MTEIKIMSIQDLLHRYHLKNSYRDMIIFITTKPNYYNFGCTKFFCLNIADTEAPMISDYTYGKLQNIICVSKEVETIYVCCDAGLSRSPAVAYFLAVKLKEYRQAEEIEKKYRFLNHALYEKLMEDIK